MFIACKNETDNKFSELSEAIQNTEKCVKLYKKIEYEKMFKKEVSRYKNNIIHYLIKLKQMDSSIDLDRFISGVIKSYEIDKMETKTPDFVGRKRYY